MNSCIPSAAWVGSLSTPMKTMYKFPSNKSSNELNAWIENALPSPSRDDAYTLEHNATPRHRAIECNIIEPMTPQRPKSAMRIGSSL